MNRTFNLGLLGYLRPKPVDLNFSQQENGTLRTKRNNWLCCTARGPPFLVLFGTRAAAPFRYKFRLLLSQMCAAVALPPTAGCRRRCRRKVHFSPSPTTVTKRMVSKPRGTSLPHVRIFLACRLQPRARQASTGTVRCSHLLGRNRGEIRPTLCLARAYLRWHAFPPLQFLFCIK